MKKAFRSILMLGLLSAGASVVHAAGDAAAGQVKAAACVACHGADGNSMVPMFPKLAGQSERYLIKQLTDFQSGARKNDMMSAMVIGKTEQDIADLAAYFSSQKVSAGLPAADATLATAGEKLYRGGNLENSTPACSACHGASGMGVPAAGFPSLKGQWPDYVTAQLKAFRAAGRNDAEGIKRDNDGELRMMRDIAAKLSDQDIQGLSQFVNGLK
ncbi:MAG TPA: c-type cytochrome [Pseudomonadales bacterium]|nr:c-type cytochrome [Pseudomonadales bacterium]